MKQFLMILQKINFMPYVIIVLLTLVIGWFLFRKSEPSETITETNEIAITKIQAIGKMELVKLTIKDVLEYNIKRKYLPDSKVLLVVSGEIVGCIDLTKIKTENIQQNDSVVTIALPAPEICYHKIDHQKSKIYNATTYYLLDNEMAITQEVYKKAENYFTSDSLKNIVFKETEKNAETMLKPLLQSVTKKTVVLRFNKTKIKG